VQGGDAAEVRFDYLAHKETTLRAPLDATTSPLCADNLPGLIDDLVPDGMSLFDPGSQSSNSFVPGALCVAVHREAGSS
jgi:hypothetical protein